VITPEGKALQNHCQLELADVTWSEEGLPRSLRYGDIYCSHTAGLLGALAEKQAVFIERTQLPARFSAGLSTSVLELGFGTGLSFLCTGWALLNAQPVHETTEMAASRTDSGSALGVVLNFYSIEKHPWSQADFLRMAAAWPMLLPLAQELAAQWPPAIPGFHRRYLAGGRIALTLIYDDVDSALKQLHGPFDAFYLDGFSPSKNAAMWSDGVFRALARLGAPGARLATYSSARAVASGLMAAGFLVEKVPGHGLKRHQLVAQLRVLPRSRQPLVPLRPKGVVVIGAGIAGMATAHALQRRHIPVQVFDQAPALGAGASGNPAGIISPLLSLDCNATTRLTLMGLGFMQAEILQLQRAGFGLAADFSGVIALARDDAHALRQVQIASELGLSRDVARWCSPDELSALSGVALTEPGWWYPNAGWLAPVDWLLAMQRAARIQVQHSCDVARLSWVDGFWVGEQACGALLFKSEQVVLANAEQAARLVPDRALGLTVCRGQVSWVDSADLSGTPQRLRVPVMREGYVLDLPARAGHGHSGLRVFGASFKPGDVDLAIRAAEQQENAERLRAICPALVPSAQAMSAASARVALRVASRDRLPLVGALRSANLAPGLWLNVGHGARGLTWGALIGEALAAQLCGEPNVLPQALEKALSPNRFAARIFA
jgi:tRNA 5-methylaminomethyl-2-thiouridine biosynthesis bifunctional protein